MGRARHWKDKTNSVEPAAGAAFTDPKEAMEVLQKEGKFSCPIDGGPDGCPYVRALVYKERYLTNILTDSADAIISMDENNIIRSWNRGAELLYGYKAEEMIGKPIDFLFPPEQKHELKLISEEVRKKGYIRNFETARRRKDGTRIEVSVTRTEVRDDDGKLIGYTAVVRDITERKRMERRLLLSEKLASVGTFAAGLAHEIKNPLNSMGIQLKLLERRISKLLSEDDRSSLQETICVIREEISRLTRLTNDFLLFSRIFSLNISREDINDIMESSLNLMKGELDAHGVVVEKSLDENLPKVEVDRERIQQVFLNLIQNAIEAMPNGGRLFVSTCRSGENVVITIEDTGIGMTKEDLDRIFEIFYSTKESGTGLGLPIVYKILERHGGEIRIDSKVGHGTKCTVMLPVNWT